MIKNIWNRIESSPNSWRIKVFLCVWVYFIFINQFIRVRPDHIFLALVIVTLSFGRDKAKRFIIDWLPFILGWVAYDTTRGIVDSLRGHIFVALPYQMEQWATGWFTGGEIIAFRFQTVHQVFGYFLPKEIFDLFCANLYTFHFAAPLLTGWILWHTANDRYLFYHFVWTLTVINIMALTTFYFFPAAPPWYVWEYGFQQPSGEMLGAAGALINVEKIIRLKFFTTLWQNMNPNYFAAIPSLHAVYPIVISYFLYVKFHRYRLLLTLYPIGVWFSSMYFNHHYLIDLLIGVGYMLVAFVVVRKILFPYIFDRTIFKPRRPGETLKQVHQTFR